MSLLSPTRHHHRLNEIIGLLLATLAILALLSLVSYHPTDPSLNWFGSQNLSPKPQNFIGIVGAYSADLLFQTLGLSSLLLPIALLIFSWRWFRSTAIETPLLKILGLCLLIFSLSTLAATLPGDLFLRWRLKTNFGGLIGQLLAEQIETMFNPAGRFIVLVATLLVALYITTSFSLHRLMDWLHAHLLGLKQRYREWHDRRVISEKEKLREAMERGDIPEKVPVINNKLPRVSEEAMVEEEMEESAEGTRPLFRRRTRKAKAAKEGLEARGPSAVEEGEFQLPPLELLSKAARHLKVDEEEVNVRAKQVKEKCAEFDVQGDVTDVHPGPVVTTFEFKPDAGVKYSRITNLEDDLCLALEAESVLIDRMPGKSTVGIEVPNHQRETIAIRTILESEEFQSSVSRLTLGLGKDVTGEIVVQDLAKMPHLLIAGSTGSGKSVAINSMLISILCKCRPDEVKLILVDPKRLELGLYRDIPHLLTPVVDEPKKASNALMWATREMENRYRRLAQHGCRNIDQYNKIVSEMTSPALDENTGNGDHTPLPYIVIVIDELADLMMIAAKDVEESITRLAQMARAVGIHLILATQRPSVDVITGLIKSNFPCRISFRVASKVDSRTILDCNGAEQLLGKGDMLLLPPGSARLVRVHGALVTESEITAVTEHLRKQAAPTYNDTVLEDLKEKEALEEEMGEKDEMYDDAVRLVVEQGKASTSTLQRRLRVGYSRAARLIDMMERDGIVGPADGSKPREVLVKKDYFREIDEALR
ncbi:MAG: DNA translocase FtsK [Acidobacteriia bacterium]|nr:DNA translocase FtsK [Terriglobia bacterium]